MMRYTTLCSRLAVLLSAVSLCSCQHYYPVAMAMGGPADSGDIQSQRFGTYYPFEEPYDCKAIGNICQDPLENLCVDFVAPNCQVDQARVRTLKSSLSAAKEQLNSLIDDQGNLVRTLENSNNELKKCQSKYDTSQSLSDRLQAELKVTHEHTTRQQTLLDGITAKYEAYLANSASQQASHTGHTYQPSFPRKNECIGNVATISVSGGSLLLASMLGAYTWKMYREKVNMQQRLTQKSMEEKQLHSQLHDVQKSLQDSLKKTDQLVEECDYLYEKNTALANERDKLKCSTDQLSENATSASISTAFSLFEEV